MSSASFTVKREFFDAIVAGTKTSEWRGGKRWAWLAKDGLNQAVFLCGKSMVRVRIQAVRIHLNDALDVPQHVRAMYPGEDIFEVMLGPSVHVCKACFSPMDCGDMVCPVPIIAGLCSDECKVAWYDESMHIIEEVVYE